MNKLPDIVFIKIEKEREPEDDFLVAVVDPSDISEAESTIDIGIYRLDKIKKLTNATTLGE
jgi:hypothetical protein